MQNIANLNLYNTYVAVIIVIIIIIVHVPFLQLGTADFANSLLCTVQLAWLGLAGVRVLQEGLACTYVTYYAQNIEYKLYCYASMCSHARCIHASGMAGGGVYCCIEAGNQQLSFRGQLACVVGLLQHALWWQYVDGAWSQCRGWVIDSIEPVGHGNRQQNG